MSKFTANENLRFIWHDLMNDRARHLAKESIAFVILGSLLLIAAPYGISIFIAGLTTSQEDLLIMGGTVFLVLQLTEVVVGFIRQQHREYFFQEEFWFLPQSITAMSFARPLSFLSNTTSDIDGGGIESLRDKVWNVIGTYIYAIIPIYSQTIFGLGACFFAHPLIGLGALLYAAVEITLGAMNNRFIQTEMKPVINRFKRWERRMSEWWHNIDHIKFHGVESKILQYIHDEVQDAIRGDDRVWRMYYTRWIAIRRMLSLAFAAPVYVAVAYFVLVSETVDGAAGVLVFFSLQRVRNTLGELSDQQREVQFNLATVAKYRRALMRPVPFAYNTGKPFNQPDISIVFEGVSHEVGDSETRTQILRDVNLTIEAGERVGIVGPSGAGKSQLMSLLVRAADPLFGQILISGTDLREWKLETLLRYYGVIMQKSEPYEDSILGNTLFGVSHLDLPIAYADMSPEAQAALEAKAQTALRKAGLAAKDFKDGTLTNIGYKGTKLSGGQQQRLQIAGAHLKLSMSEERPRFVLADEPTASLDSMSEVTVMKYLDELPSCTTMCMVAHRLSTVADMDKIVMVRPLSMCDEHTEQVTVHDSLYELYQTDALFREMADHQKYQPRVRCQVA